MMVPLGEGMPGHVHEPKSKQLEPLAEETLMSFLFHVLNALGLNQILMRRHSRSQHGFFPQALFWSASVL